LTLWYSVALAAVLFLFGLALYGIISYLLIRQVDLGLQTAAKSIENVSSVTAIQQKRWLDVPLDENLSAASIVGQVWAPDGSLVSQSESLQGYDQPLDAGALINREYSTRSIWVDRWHWRVYTAELNTFDGERLGYLQLAASLRFVDNVQGTLLIVLLGGGVLAVALAAMIGWFSASRALKPINTITRTALQISRADDLSRRVPVKDPNDELGRMSIAFNETLERLDKQFMAQRRFLADVSHELRTPLTAIRGNVDLLQRMGSADPDSLRDIRSETERMTRLVGDLLVLAQADSGSLPLEKKPLELDGLLLEVCRETQVLAANVHLTVGDIDQARVVGDMDRLKQVILNLVTNALKYTPAGGRVTLGLARVNRWARLTVSDNGIGIPADELPKIFDRFYRVDKARSRAMGGAGLGLSIAQRIAQMHGGRIEAASDGLDKGTTFSLWLPLADAPPETDTAKTQPLRRPFFRPEPTTQTKA
jgi:heavy metal sensor kinase